MRSTILADDVTLAQLDHYRDTGWMMMPGFFSERRMAEIASWTDELLDEPERPDGPMLYREPSLLDDGTRVVQRIENICAYHPGFDTLIRRDRLARVVERLLGGAAVLFKEKINFKMPGGNGFEPHQDQQAGWSSYAPFFLTALVSIDPSTIANGCLEVVSGRRQTAMIGPEWKPLSTDILGTMKVVHVETKPGDVIFFDSYVPHLSKPNLTGRSRRNLYITWNHAADGDHRARYYSDKRAAFPPDIERKPGVEYRFKV